MADESTPASPTPETPPPRTTGGNWRWEPPTAEELQKLMPGYTIEKLLGRGGMGAVYRGVQTNLDRPVAIKILPPGVEKEDPSFAERFKSEARLMARLSNPAVVGVFDFGTNSGGQMYFAMEYVDGSDVSQMIATQGKLPPEHALAITAHVCDALSAAHELGIVHRDIKPANVLINMKGQVKVADFGLAKIEDPGQHGLTKTGYAMGTPDFVAPEALTLGAAIDGRADLYAVGVMLYQMLTGNIPRGAFKPASVLVPGLDPRFDPIILKAMQHDRAERHQSAAELRRELDVILTVPFVRNDAPASAAIPVAQMAQAPGQRSAAQKPQPWSAGAPTRQPSVKAGEGTRAPETPSKSKTPLFIGLGVAAAIGIGAFVMMGGKKEAKQSGPLNRSAAEIASQGLPEGRAERGNPLSGTSVPPQATKPAQGTVRTTISPPEPAKPQPKPAPTPVSSSPSLPISASSDKFPPGQWVKVFAKFEDLPEKVRMTGSDLKYEDGWIKLRKDSDNYITLAPELTTNYAVRARLRADTMAKLPGTLTLRRASSTTFYQIGVGRSNGLSVMKLSGGIYTMLANDPAKKQPQPGAEYVIEAAVIGQHIVSRFNGATPLLFVNDTSYGNGNAAVTGSEDVRDIEVINLDGLTEAEALKILGVDEKGNDLRQTAPVAATSPVPSTPKSPTLPASPSGTQFPPGQWVKVFTKFEDLPENLRKPNSGMRWENGTLEAANEIYLGKIPSLGAMKSCAMRFVVSKDAAIQARMRDKNDKAYYSISTTSLNRWNPQSINGSLKSLAQFTLPDSPGPIRKYEFAMVGTRLVVRSDNDHILASLVDDQIDQGDILFGKLKGIMRDIEVINLDGLPEAEALRIIGIDEKGNDLRALAAKQEQQMAEQAKVVDAMAAIPELKALHEQFVKLQAERVAAPLEADVAKLNAGYVGGIDRKIAEEKAAGHLDGIIALEAEKKLLADQQPIPADDAEGTTANLKALRAIYHAAYAKIEAARVANLKQLTDPLTLRLKQLESTLTQKDRVADAKVVREYREGLGRGADTPVRESSNGDASAKTNEADKSAGTQTKISKPKNAFTEREAAEWVLSFAGKGAASVTVLVPGKGEQQIQSLAQLPKEKFLVRKLTITPTQVADRDLITDKEVLRLMGLEDVRFIDLSYGKITSLALRALGQIPTLAELHFPGGTLSAADLAALENAGYKQLHLNSLFLKDEAAMRVFGTMKNLRSLNLAGLIDAEMMAAMPVLPKLEIFTTTVNDRVRDDFLPLLPKKFPALQRIDLWEASKVQGDTMASLKELKDLIDLGINHTQVDDDKLSAIADMKHLQRLGIAGTKVTDGCIPTLKMLKSLHTLSIFQTQITDGGLLELAELRSLKTLNVRHTDSPPIGPPATGFTEAGVAAFQKKRPDVMVTK